jgi:hypothetical protein
MPLRNACLAALLAAAILLILASAASAQTLIPPLPGLGGGDDHPPQQQAQAHDQPSCFGPSLLCDPGTVVDATGDVVGAGVGVAADAVMGGIVGWAASGAAWLVRTIARQVDRSTRPALGSAWFARRYASMRLLAVSLALLFLLAAIAHAVMRQDLVMLARSCLVALPLALLLTFAAVTLVELGLAVTDSLTAAAVGGVDGDVAKAFRDLGGALRPTAVVPGLVLFLGSILIAVLSLVVWIELILREAAIYVAVAFLPLALAAITWPRTAHWARRLAEWIAAIVLAKLAIAVSFAVAGAMLAHARGGTGGLSAIFGGCAVLLIAALSPWVLLRLIPFAEQAPGSLQRSHVGGALKAAPGAAASSLLVRQAMLKSFTAGLASTPAAARGRNWTPPRQRMPSRTEEAHRGRSA